MRLQQFGLGANHVIPDPLPAGLPRASLVFSLGYEDNSYGDNGYYRHDDGTEGQCTSSVNAFVVVSVTHKGSPPVSAENFVGITPDKFRCAAAWAFHNFKTPTLSWGTFTDAFSLSVLDYLDPATYVSYLAGSKLAAGGNCAGMSLLSLVGEDQFLVGNLQELFWQKYKNPNAQNPDVQRAINTAHWGQLSTYFLKYWLSGYFSAPGIEAAKIERDLTKADYNYGLLSIAHGLGGHVLVPLRVSHTGNEILIDVYDPNRQCGSVPDPATYPRVVITGNRWSYEMAGSDGTWTGSDGLVYIPYVGQDGWSELGTNGSGMLAIIFGTGTSVDQVTDARGHHLFLADGKPQIDYTGNGLGHTLLRLPVYSQVADQKRPRDGALRFSVNHTLPQSPVMQAREHELETEYGPDYAAGASILLTTDADLGNLTFKLSRTSLAHPVRAMIKQNGAFFEVRTAVPGTDQAGPQLTIVNVKNLADGVAMASSFGRPLNVVFTQGAVASPNHPTFEEKTTPVTVVSPTRASVVNGQFSLAVKGPATMIATTTKIIQPSGAILQSTRSASIHALQ